jgi:SAM-dependent methyltransferase
MPGAGHTSNLSFRVIQKIGIIHVRSGVIWGMPVQEPCPNLRGEKPPRPSFATAVNYEADAHRAPSWPFSQEGIIRYDFKEAAECDMCGSTRRKHLGLRLSRSTGLRPRSASGIGVAVKQCLDCGLIYADPMPIPLSLEDHYDVDPEAYFTDGLLQSTAVFNNDDLAGLMDVRPGMKAVDVGAGVGTWMLGLMKAGWDTWGIEPSQSFAEFGITKMGINKDRLLIQSFEETTLPSDEFDLVNFSSVLEHLRSPAAALRQACRIVRPGGIITGGVPSASALLPRLLNLYYRVCGTTYVTNISPMHPPYHLYEFTHRSFVANGKKLGYEVAKHVIWTPPIFNIPAKLQPVLRPLLDRIGRGDGLIVFLRKKVLR